MSKHHFRADLRQGRILASIADIRRILDDDSVTREVGDEAVTIFQRHALVDTGRMAGGIHVEGSDPLLIAVDARDPETGYNYVGVTRKGHRHDKIRPRARRTGSVGRNPASVIKTRKLRRHGWRAALKTPYGFRWWTRGFHPSSDWAERALPEVKDAADQHMDRLGFRVARRWRA